MAGSDTTKVPISEIPTRPDTLPPALVLGAIRKAKGGLSAPQLATMFPKETAKCNGQFPRVAARRTMQALADAGHVDLYYVGRELVAVLPGRAPSD